MMTQPPALSLRPSQAAPTSTRRGLTHIRLMQFRSYKSLKFSCDARPVVLTGENGAGKTNILEAISYLAPGRGLRAAKLSQVALSDAQGQRSTWSVNVTVEAGGDNLNIRTGYTQDPTRPTEKRLIKIGDENARSQAELGQYLSVIWLTPQMDGLFREGAAERRKFLDKLIASFDTTHGGRVYRFEHALKERSRLLKQGIGDPHWLQTLETTMAETGVAIAYARQEAVAQLAQASAWATGIFPQADLMLTGPLENWIQKGLSALEVEEKLKFSLRDSRSLDATQGSAKDGPHRTDLMAYYREKAMPAANCSTGEQKALLISLVMAAMRVHAIHQRGTPLLLLDEVVAHLDPCRREALYAEIHTLKMQVWMTGTDFSAFAPLQDRAQYFMVKHSEIFNQDT